MKLLAYIPSWIKNKYFIALSIFMVFMLFLGRNDLFTQLDRRSELRKLEQSKEHYSKLINTERKELEALKTNPATLEKYAREKYFMKKDGEEVFVISEKPLSPKN